MASIFSKIASGEIPCYKVTEDKNYIAFLDISPLVKGHVLVIPKLETDYIFDIEDDSYQGLWIFAKKVAKAIKISIPCKRVGIAVIGLEVAHAHIHLIPLQSMRDIDFSQPKLQLSNQELTEIAQQISFAIV